MSLIHQQMLKAYLKESRRELHENARMAIACLKRAERRGKKEPERFAISESASIETRRALTYLGHAIAAATDLDRIRERIEDGEEK